MIQTLNWRQYSYLSAATKGDSLQSLRFDLYNGALARIVVGYDPVQAQGLTAAVGALRWLLPTMAFEFFRESEHRYLSAAEFHETLRRAGFEVIESRQTFLSGLSHLAWCRTA